MKFEEIISSLKKKDFRPIYFLMGDESYFIDKITDYISKNILSETEKGFNQSILYGKDTTVEQIISIAKQFPIMGEKSIVIVKEAQHLKKIEGLESYLNNPVASTLLVICYKNKTLDKRKKITKELKQKAVLFESKNLYDNQIPSWIQQYLQKFEYNINPKATQLLAEFLGTNLSKISNELDKLMISIPKEVTITSEIIEENIGFSKDFNNFELTKALGEKNVLKTNQIANYFAKNSKENPLLVTISVLFSYFQKLLILHTLSDKSQSNVASKIKVNPYFANDYIIGSRSYSKRKVVDIISLLRSYDLKSKGLDNYSQSQGELLRELLYRILH